MVRYAQNCPLPCNPTLDESQRYQKQYKSTQKLLMLSEDKLKMRMRSFLDNHLVDVIQTFSLISKGSQSKIFKLENQRKKSLYDEKRNNLQNIYSYFQENIDSIRYLESKLKENFQHKIQEIFQKVKVSLQSTIDMYQTLVKNKIDAIRSQIKQSLSNIQREMNKLEHDQRLKMPQTINGRLTYDQISKLLNVPSQDVKGYITILKMIERKSPLMQKIAIFEENFNENDQFSCEREIGELKINCNSINCGEMWNVIQLLKKKRDFNTSFSFSQNSSSSLQNSFTSYQNPVQDNSFTSTLSEIQSSELNPEIQFSLQDLIIRHVNSLKSLQQKIIHNLHAVFHKQDIVSNEENSQQQTNHQRKLIKSQPLGFYLNQNKVYQIICQTKESIEHLFAQVYEINRCTHEQFCVNTKKQYYEPLQSDSQKDDSSDEEEQSRYETKLNENIQPQKKEEMRVIQKQQIRQQVQSRNQEIPQPSPISEIESNVSFPSKFTFAGQQSNIKQEFQNQPINEQDAEQTQHHQNETQIRYQDQEESRIHYASQSQSQPQQVAQQKEQIHKKQAQQPKIPEPQIEKQSESEKDQPSVAEQYSEYIKKMKQKGSEFLEEKQSYNSKIDEKPLYRNRQYEQEERKMQEYQRKLDRQDQKISKNSSKMFEKDQSLQSDPRLRSYFDNSEHQSQIENSRDKNYPHHLSKQQKFIGYSTLEKDPQMKKIAEQWVNSRKKQQYRDFPNQRQEQNGLIQYVSYDYQPENQRQKPYQGPKSIKDQFLNVPEHEIQNILPQQISEFSDIEIEQQRRIQESIRKDNSLNMSRQENSTFKKIEKVVKDVIVPGFHAFKKQKQNPIHQSIRNVEQQGTFRKIRQEELLIKAKQQELLRKAKQQEDLQKSILQFALEDSLQQYQNNQNKSLNFNKISQIKQSGSNNNRLFQQPRIPSNREFEDNFEQDFTQFQQFFKGLSSIKAPFSLEENSGINFLDELEQQRRRPITRRKLNDQIQIKQIKARQDELDISKEEFSIVVRVLKPILLTFKSMDKRGNSPMTKFIVGDQTGIAVLYMRYYCDVKPGICLRLNRCRVCKYRSSFEITNVSRITTMNVLQGNYITEIKYNNPLSLLRGSSINELSYEVRPDFNDLLRDCVRDMLRNGNQREQMIRKPLILTVCDANLPMRRYLLGDYTGRIVAQMGDCPKLLAKHETVLIKNIRICIRGDRILLVGQRNTVILKADFDWKFKHDLQYIPNEQFKLR